MLLDYNLKGRNLVVRLNGVLRYYALEFSAPLLVGMVLALALANAFPHEYHEFVHYPWLGVEWLNLHFFINDIFMAFFFALAAKEIKEAFLPKGALAKKREAANPLFATVGGMAVPAALCFVLLLWFYGSHPEFSQIVRGWPVPTATDIALVLVAARLVFGRAHPAVAFLLLLAVLDDAGGMLVIATVLKDPHHPTQWNMLLLVVVAMGAAWMLKKLKATSWLLYIGPCGLLSWLGFYSAGLHPALGLVPVVFMMPSAKVDAGLFVESNKKDTLGSFEHAFKYPVELGLFFFALANAGVLFSEVTTLTWIIFGSLVAGKTLGICGLSLLGEKLGFPVPATISRKELFVLSYLASIGLTVAVFMAGQAYIGAENAYVGPAKMGAVFSGVAMILGPLLGKKLGIHRIQSQ